MLGKALRPRCPNRCADSLEVAHIVPGSPAEDTGLRSGDQVTHVDGVPVNERGCRDMQQRAGFVDYTFRRNSAEQTARVEKAVLLQ